MSENARVQNGGVLVSLFDNGYDMDTSWHT